MQKRIDSNDNQEFDSSINIGTGGSILTYYRIYQFFKQSGQYDGTNVEQKQYIEQFL